MMPFPPFGQGVTLAELQQMAMNQRLQMEAQQRATQQFEQACGLLGIVGADLLNTQPGHCVRRQEADDPRVIDVCTVCGEVKLQSHVCKTGALVPCT